ncbi:MAG: hypothetical protein R2710_25065 [Acidimicrobiales bacterium]
MTAKSSSSARRERREEGPRSRRAATARSRLRRHPSEGEALTGHPRVRLPDRPARRAAPAGGSTPPAPSTSSRPGLQRIDAVWKLLGRLNVLQAMSGASTERAIVLTSSLPVLGRQRTRRWRRRPGVIFDLIEIYDPAGLERLRRCDRSRPGTARWLLVEEDLSRNS